MLITLHDSVITGLTAQSDQLLATGVGIPPAADGPARQALINLRGTLLTEIADLTTRIATVSATPVTAGTVIGQTSTSQEHDRTLIYSPPASASVCSPVRPARGRVGRRGHLPSGRPPRPACAPDRSATADAAPAGVSRRVERRTDTAPCGEPRSLRMRRRRRSDGATAHPSCAGQSRAMHRAPNGGGHRERTPVRRTRASAVPHPAIRPLAGRAAP